jgi:hypothetical protein
MCQSAVLRAREALASPAPHTSGSAAERGALPGRDSRITYSDQAASDVMRSNGRCRRVMNVWELPPLYS